MRVTEFCPSPHLEAADIGDDIGATKVVTIRGVTKKEVGAEKVLKGVVFFEEFDRGMVVNRTNSNTIAALHGGETDNWIGCRITLYRSEAAMNGKIVPCIRVKDSVPKELEQTAAPAKKGKK